MPGVPELHLRRSTQVELGGTISEVCYSAVRRLWRNMARSHQTLVTKAHKKEQLKGRKESGPQ